MFRILIRVILSEIRTFLILSSTRLSVFVSVRVSHITHNAARIPFDSCSVGFSFHLMPTQRDAAAL